MNWQWLHTRMGCSESVYGTGRGFQPGKGATAFLGVVGGLGLIFQLHSLLSCWSLLKRGIHPMMDSPTTSSSPGRVEGGPATWRALEQVVTHGQGQSHSRLGAESTELLWPPSGIHSRASPPGRVPPHRPAQPGAGPAWFGAPAAKDPSGAPSLRSSGPGPRASACSRWRVRALTATHGVSWAARRSRPVATGVAKNSGPSALGLRPAPAARAWMPGVPGRRGPACPKSASSRRGGQWPCSPAPPAVGSPAERPGPRPVPPALWALSCSSSRLRSS